MYRYNLAEKKLKENKIKEAEIIVTQGGFGSIADCLRVGKKVVAVPRKPEFKESPDRQEELVRELEKLGRLVGVYDIDELPEAIKKAKKQEPNFWIRYCVFSDFRKRGYIIKTALKFGADFRVYERGVKPGEDHAKWVVYPVHEASTLTWYEFSAKNRVAHSTKKRLMIGVVDDEGDVTYYEIRWMRP